MDQSERFEIVGVQYPGRGYTLALRSDVRGESIFDSQGFVNNSGYRDLEFVPRLVAEIAWYLGARHGQYAGVMVCSVAQLENITQLFAFRPNWYWGGGSASIPFVSFFESRYILRPKSKIDVADLTESNLIEGLYLMPRFPDTSVALKVEDGATMVFIQDLRAESLPFVASLCESMGVPMQFTEPYGAELQSMSGMTEMLLTLTDIVMRSENSQQQLHLAKWYDRWHERTEPEESSCGSPADPLRSVRRK